MPKSPALTYASIQYTDNGTPYSSEYGDVYHSSAGGLGQALHVFLEGNLLPQRWAKRRCFTILETGFGLGLNFLCTWANWQQDPERCAQLHFISFEKHPFQQADLQHLHQAWPEFAELTQQLHQQWPLLTAGFHRLSFAEGRVLLTLVLGEAMEWLPQLVAEVDAFYLDGFSPSKNPDLWSERLFHQISRLAHPEATAATYTVAAAVRHGLELAGFQVEKHPGFGGKRDCLRAQHRRQKPQRLKPSHPKTAIILGAGIAGTSIAHHLAKREWNLTLIDRQAGPGKETSGNLAGIFAPILSLDDNLQTRLARACIDYNLRLLPQLPGHFVWGQPGVLQLALEEGQEQRQKEIISALQLPPHFAQYVDQNRASELAGTAMPCGGWWFAQGAWVSPPQLSAAFAEHPNIHPHYHCDIRRIEKHNEGWRVFDATGKQIASANILILANGCDANQFAPQLSIQGLRRQVSHIPAQALPDLQIVLCREGYLTPALDGIACLGASQDPLATELIPSLPAHQDNLNKLAQLLPDYPTQLLDIETLSGRVGKRPSTPDRLPLVGAIPDFAQAPQGGISQLHQIPRIAGLYGLLGFGARGLTWAALSAELLASQLCGEPLPLDKKLVEAVDPARFWLRELRQTSANRKN